MLTLKADKLSKEWNGQLVFEDVTMEIFAGEHVALIGANGAGKTTLLQVLMGRIEADTGSIWRGVPAAEWGLLEQEPKVDEQLTTLEFIESGSPELFQLKKQMRQLRTLIEQGIRTVPFGHLSGGQKTRAQLARLMLQNPKLILLDEPTNHLDQESLNWLEEWINQYPGTVLIVSHDRYFLDQVAHVTYELTKQGTKRYKGGYSDFRAQREAEIKTQQALYQKQQKRKQELLDAIQRYRQWFQKAHQSAGERNPFLKKKANKNITRLQAKEKELKRLESNRVERPTDRAQVQVRFAESELGARSLLSLENLSFSYGDRPIFQDLSMNIRRGDRIAVSGPNGSGKSTLLKLIVGDLEPAAGKVVRNPQLQIGYFAQELEKLDPNESILESLLRLPNMSQAEARTILACFLFRKEEVFKRIGELSMGEKCRVAFVRLYFSEANLLVLDEPTNYLDIETRERIEEALENYLGALVVVSHDRYLLQKVANRVIALNRGQIQQFSGTFKEYEENGRINNGESIDRLHADRIRMLELQVIQLMGQEVPEDLAERERIVQVIREIRAEIQSLKDFE